MIIVTGATGTIGSQVIRALQARKAAFKTMVRSEAAAARLQAQGVATVTGDLDHPASMAEAFQGADTLFLLAPGGPGIAEQERRAIEAARTAGVGRVVQISGMAASVESTGVFQRLHGQAEACLRDSGLAWTILRPNGFMQNFPAFYGQTVAQGQPIHAPMGVARVSWVAAEDVGEAAAAVLCEAGHEGRVYELTGPAAVSYLELAQMLSDLLGRPVNYVNVPDSAAQQAMSALGPWLAHALVSLNQIYRKGLAESPTGTVEILTGRPARSLESFLAANIQAFQA